MPKHLFLYSNDTPASRNIVHYIQEKFQHDSSMIVQDTLSQDTDMIICIGGDGTLLHLIHEYDFPDIPIVGVNTGHLGFFQDLEPSQIDQFFTSTSRNGIHVRTYSTIQSQIWTEERTYTLNGLNEMVIRGKSGSVVHLDMTIGNSFIEHFGGDGLIVSTPAGSTAYNYSLDGSIIDPRLDLLQVTPIAPMNNHSYRSFTSSLILPSDNTLKLVPQGDSSEFIQIETDGFVHHFNQVKMIRLSYSKKKLKIATDFNKDFWRKVKDKFL